jgi:uncharacterized membrane protein
MLLGYCFGTLYLKDTDASYRKLILLQTGIGMIVAFVVIRLVNVYGDPSPWSVQQSGIFTLLSFLNVTKYPPSLDYILVTLGPALVFLALSENLRGSIIHIVAVVAALATGFEFSDMIFSTWVTDSPNLRGYGFNLGITYLIWISIVLALFPICLWYDRYKTRNKDKWWLSYL